MQRIRGVLIDVSGTVHVGDKAIPGAVQALDRLRASGIPVWLTSLFLSLSIFFFSLPSSLLSRRRASTTVLLLTCTLW
jgi:hypothetical protein